MMTAKNLQGGIRQEGEVTKRNARAPWKRQRVITSTAAAEQLVTGLAAGRLMKFAISFGNLERQVIITRIPLVTPQATSGTEFVKGAPPHEPSSNFIAFSSHAEASWRKQWAFLAPSSTACSTQPLHGHLSAAARAL